MTKIGSAGIQDPDFSGITDGVSPVKGGVGSQTGKVGAKTVQHDGEDVLSERINKIYSQYKIGNSFHAIAGIACSVVGYEVITRYETMMSLFEKYITS